MDRQYGNPSEYQQVEYAPQQMMYSVAPGQQVVGPPLVNVPGGPASMPPHLWAAADPHLRQGGAPTQPGGPGVGDPRGGPMGDGVGGVPVHHHSSADAMEELLGPFPVVRLRGLPFEAQPRDVVLFFQGIGVLDVVMMPRGEAIVVFNTVMDCQMALGRDRQNMGRRYIEIFQAKRFDYYNAVGHTHWHTGHGHNHHSHGGQHPHHHLHGNPHHAQGGERDHRGHGGRRLHQHRGEKEHSHHHGSSGANGGAGSTNGGSREAAIANSERAQNSGILKLRGLPFASNKQDIQQLFEGYPLRPEQIQFVFRGDGRLTGEAFVTFTGGAEEAKAAQRAKDRSTIGSRYVEIFNTTPEELARLTGGGSNGGNANGGPGANSATAAGATSNPQGSSTASSGGSTTVGESSSSSAGSGSTTGGGEGATAAAAAAPAVAPAEGADAPASSSSPTSAST